MSDYDTKELLKLSEELLDTIARADWAAYAKLCDPSLSCFEPEAMGQLVTGLDFHEFYFKLGGVQGLIRSLSSIQFVIKAFHKLLGGCVGRFPERSDHLMGSGS